MNSNNNNSTSSTSPATVPSSPIMLIDDVVVRGRQDENLPPSLTSPVAAASTSSAQLTATSSALVSPNKMGSETQSKINALMHLIGKDVNDDGFVPLPSFDDLLKQVAEAQMLTPQPLPRLVTADVMDCFRLYFGSSVTTFPFYAARLGAVGFVFAISGAGYLGLMTQMALHRARYNIILLELQRRMDRETSGGDAKVTSHTSSIEMGAMTPTNSSSRSPSPSQLTSPTTDPSTPSKKRKVKPPPDPSDMMAYFFKVDTMVKVCNTLWPDHWMKNVFSAITFVAQFFGCCSYTLLFASNVGPVLGLGDSAAVYLGSALMAVLTMATAPKAKTIMAYFNNIFIFGGACIILLGSFIHERTEEEKNMVLQILPKSTADIAMYAPSVLTYMSAQLLTIDAESIVAMRAYRLLQGKEPEPSPESLASSPAVSVTSSPVSQTGPMGFPSPKMPHHKASGLFFSAHFGGLRAETLKSSMINVLTVQACYDRAVKIGLVLSMIVLTFFAELIMYNFKDSTNAIIALSLPVSTLRTCVLICLSIGLYACGALNVSPICDMLDTFCASLQQMDWLPVLKQGISRAVLFVFVVFFLYLVPFFDMVAALSSALCTPMFAFFIPSACELQSEILRAAAKPELKEMMAAASPLTRILVGWSHMCLKAKITMLIAMILGAIILSFSTTTVLQEIWRRHEAAE